MGSISLISSYTSSIVDFRSSASLTDVNKKYINASKGMKEITRSLVLMLRFFSMVGTVKLVLKKSSSKVDGVTLI